MTNEPNKYLLIKPKNLFNHHLNNYYTEEFDNFHKKKKINLQYSQSSIWKERNMFPLKQYKAIIIQNYQHTPKCSNES